MAPTSGTAEFRRTTSAPGSERAANGPLEESRFDECVRERISECPYSYYFKDVTWEHEAEELVLEGRVPTFYMKQVLQTLLRGVGAVKQITNNVNVISSTGLSSPPNVHSN